MGLLEGQNVVITGGASGIGAATARLVHEHGGAVAIVDIDEAGAHAVAADVAGAGFVADVSDPEACRAAITAADAALGGMTALFNNAGIGAAKPLHDYSDRLFAKLVDVNLAGTFYGIRAAVPLLRARGGGCIVNHASVSGIRPTRFEGPYSAAKAGVISLTMDAALEYGPDLRVNCVSPGLIETPLTAGVLADREVRTAVEDATPLRRVGTASDVANAVVFLMSPLAAYITGHNLVVDGGSYLPNSQADAILRQFGM
ncbi:MAG: SDR family oxidoreductase [Acidimicrobiia bacterium]|nr:SDR family oxidoreductase [Acidimicrobiia bacterium]